MIWITEICNFCKLCFTLLYKIKQFWYLFWILWKSKLSPRFLWEFSRVSKYFGSTHTKSCVCWVRKILNRNQNLRDFLSRYMVRGFFLRFWNQKVIFYSSKVCECSSKVCECSSKMCECSSKMNEQNIPDVKKWPNHHLQPLYMNSFWISLKKFKPIK